MGVALKPKPEAAAFGPWMGRKEIMGPDGPIRKCLKLTLSPDLYAHLEGARFVRMNLVSPEGAFAIRMVLKDADSFLELVPRRMPQFTLPVGPKELVNGFESGMMVAMAHPDGRSRLFTIAAIAPAGLLDDGKGAQRKRYAC